MSANDWNSWEDATRRRARLLQRSLLGLHQWVAEAGGDRALLERLARPTEKLLDEVYERDLPLARLLDRADVVVRVTGPGVDEGAPRVSILAELFTDWRTRVSSVARQLAEGAGLKASEMDLALAGMAPGSIIVGFAIPRARDRGLLPGIEDNERVTRATREAVRLLFDAARVVDGTAGALGDASATLDAVDHLAPTPDARDAVLTALHHLSPSSRSGVDRVEITGRDLPSVALSATERRASKDLLRQATARAREDATFVGTVREIDLDEHRFTLRSVTSAHAANGPEPAPTSLRCAYGEATPDKTARSWLDREALIVGRLERDARGRPALLWADDVRDDATVTDPVGSPELPHKAAAGT